MDARPAFELRDRALEFDLRPPWWGSRWVRTIMGLVLGMIGPPLIVQLTTGRFPVPTPVMLGSIAACGLVALFLPVPPFPRRVRFGNAGLVLMGPGERRTPVAWLNIALAAGRTGLEVGVGRLGIVPRAVAISARSSRLIVRLSPADAPSALAIIAERAPGALVLPFGGSPTLPVQPDGVDRDTWLTDLHARIQREFNTQAAHLAAIASAAALLGVFIGAMAPAAFAKGHPRAAKAVVLAIVALAFAAGAAQRVARTMRRKRDCLAALARDVAREAPFYQYESHRRPDSRAA